MFVAVDHSQIEELNPERKVRGAKSRQSLPAAVEAPAPVEVVETEPAIETLPQPAAIEPTTVTVADAPIAKPAAPKPQAKGKFQFKKKR